jgi:hypothetical protein
MVLALPSQAWTAPEGESIWLLIGTAGMLLGMVYFIAAGWGENDPRKQEFYVITVFVPAIAAVSYLAMSLGYGVTTITVDDAERTIYWARYADWLFTTPLLLMDLALLADADRNTIATLIGLDVAMVVTGLMGALTNRVDPERAAAVGEAISAGEFTTAFERVTPAMLEAFCIAGTPGTVEGRVADILTEADSVVAASPLGPDAAAIDLAGGALRRASE